jgi:hypothetical protein
MMDGIAPKVGGERVTHYPPGDRQMLTHIVESPGLEGASEELHLRGLELRELPCLVRAQSQRFARRLWVGEETLPRGVVGHKLSQDTLELR